MNRAAMAVSQNQSLAFLTAQPPPPPPPTHREAQEVRLTIIFVSSTYFPPLVDG
jgi:hypothetical protein